MATQMGGRFRRSVLALLTAEEQTEWQRLIDRCQVSGVRCQVSGVRCQGSGVRGQVSGVRGQVSGVRCQVSGLPRSAQARRWIPTPTPDPLESLTPEPYS